MGFRMDFVSLASANLPVMFQSRLSGEADCKRAEDALPDSTMDYISVLQDHGKALDTLQPQSSRGKKTNVFVARNQLDLAES